MNENTELERLRKENETLLRRENKDNLISYIFDKIGNIALLIGFISFVFFLFIFIKMILE